jgi:hypothetical protein
MEPISFLFFFKKQKDKGDSRTKYLLKSDCVLQKKKKNHELLTRDFNFIVGVELEIKS